MPIFFDWLCDGSDVNEAFKMEEVADLNLPSDLPIPQVDSTDTGNKLACATLRESVGLKPIIH